MMQTSTRGRRSGAPTGKAEGGGGGGDEGGNEGSVGAAWTTGGRLRSTPVEQP
jgi:hypothetical protein